MTALLCHNGCELPPAGSRTHSEAFDVVSFLSLFLGLVFGYQTVALEVAEPVARVELLLDGAVVGSLQGPAWQGPIDLGPELRPHELIAIAYDESGSELDRTRQWLNLPRQPAETTILLEHDRETDGRIARISWRSLIDDEPSAVRVEFDGVEIEFDDPRAIPLPPHDPQLLHFLRVELEFAGVLTASAEVTFGGIYADQVNSELTALPVEPVGGRKRLPPESELQSAFRARGRNLRLAAVEKGQVDLVVVRDQSAWPRLRAIRTQALTSPSANAAGSGLPGADTRQGWLRPDTADWSAWSYQFLWPTPRRHDAASGPYDLFSHSARHLATAGSLHGWATTIEQPREWTGIQRLADAVAIAGVTAASANRRRAVLLILGENPEDTSEASPAMVRRYLESLAVPLFIWTVSPTGQDSTWGAAIDVSTPRRMSQATRQIHRRLEAQRIVWLEGIHLPQQIEVSAPLTKRLKAAG
jgi:hypothetical protein